MFIKTETAQRLDYYFWASYRRKLLDKFQARYRKLLGGVVLDIGGRVRGRFMKELAGIPAQKESGRKQRIKKWITVDIQKKNKPDLVMDVARMDKIKSGSIDTINAAELFEHVSEIDKGLDECARVLKNGGLLIISVPFLSRVHGDPYDFQRWTHWKWKKELTRRGLRVKRIEVMGRYFTVLADMIKVPVYWWPGFIRPLFYLGYPLLDLLTLLDKTKWVRESKALKGYHGGYFIVAKK